MNKLGVLLASAIALSLAGPALAATKPICPAIADASAFSEGNERPVATFLGKDGWLSSPFELQEGYELPTGDRLKWLVEALASKGTKLAIVAIPGRPMVYPEKMPDGAQSAAQLEASREAYRAAIAALQGDGVIAVDALAAMLAAKDQGDVFFAHDHHWTPLGAEAIAGALATALKADPGFPASGLQFTKSAGSPVVIKGSFLAAARDLCGDTTLKDETFVPDVTERADSGGLGLFGDEAAPQIVLVGTSFSLRDDSDQFNFVGSLSEQTGEDVLNAAVNGGGSFTAIQDYLGSEEFHTSPPKYLVWETSTTFNAPGQSLTSQLIGTIGGSCEGAAVLQSTSNGNAPLTLDLASVLGASGPQYYLQLQFDDLSARNATVTFKNADGKERAVSLSLQSRSSRGGNLYAELPRNFGTIQTASIDMPSASGTKTARLCQVGSPAIPIASVGSAIRTSLPSIGSCSAGPIWMRFDTETSPAPPAIALHKLWPLRSVVRSGQDCVITITPLAGVGAAEFDFALADKRADGLSQLLRVIGYQGTFDVALDAMADARVGKFGGVEISSSPR